MYFKQIATTDKTTFEAIHGGIGEIKRRNLFSSNSNLPVNIEIWELKEGVTEGNHTHGNDRPLEEIYYFLSGNGEMTIAGDVVTVGPDDAVMVPPRVEHDIRNTGVGALKVMIIWGVAEDELL